MWRIARTGAAVFAIGCFALWWVRARLGLVSVLSAGYTAAWVLGGVAGLVAASGLDGRKTLSSLGEVVFCVQLGLGALLAPVCYFARLRWGWFLVGVGSAGVTYAASRLAGIRTVAEDERARMLNVSRRVTEAGVWIAVGTLSACMGFFVGMALAALLRLQSDWAVTAALVVGVVAGTVVGACRVGPWAAGWYRHFFRWRWGLRD